MRCEALGGGRTDLNWGTDESRIFGLRGGVEIAGAAASVAPGGRRADASGRSKRLVVASLQGCHQSSATSCERLGDGISMTATKIGLPLAHPSCP